MIINNWKYKTLQELEGKDVGLPKLRLSIQK